MQTPFNAVAQWWRNWTAARANVASLDCCGARWSVAGAEAVLKLRALKVSGDFDAYWRFHLDREHERNHASR